MRMKGVSVGGEDLLCWDNSRGNDTYVGSPDIV